MRISKLRRDGEAGCRNLIRIVDALVWVPAGCVVVALMVWCYWWGIAEHRAKVAKV